NLLELAAAGTEMRAQRPLVAIPADEGRIGYHRGRSHKTCFAIQFQISWAPRNDWLNNHSITTSPKRSRTNPRRSNTCDSTQTQKKWLGGGGAQHPADDPSTTSDHVR